MTFSGLAKVAESGTTTRIAVDVTFLSRDPGAGTLASLPLGEGDRLDGVSRPTVDFYRFLYSTVGREYCWWLRRIATDAELAALLADPRIGLHVLYRGGAPAGFFELDGRDGRSVNIAYFGLMPHAIGTGVGRPLLHEAVRLAQNSSPNGLVRVNTCTADHPRALPNYLAAGFRSLRTVRELWDIPDRLGLPIPDRLRV